MKLGNHTIVLLSREATGQRDRYNAPILRDVYSEHRWCSVTPTSSSEPGDQSAPRVQGLQLLAPKGTPLDAAAAVIWPATATDNPDAPWTGPRYEVIGDVGIWDHCVQAELSRSS